MCGILFQISKEKIDIEKFNKALLLQKHRGPDHTGVKQYNDKMFFGHVRLSIIDLPERSNQPMMNDEGSNVIIFNGEIYNYIELKKDLQHKNINFKTEGDTEVLLKSLEFYGIEAIKNFNGAWSFLYYNKKDNKLVLSRDRFGKNPLYYYQDEKTFIVSSEIKSIFYLLQKKRIIRKEQIELFIKYNFLPNDNEKTLYHDIYQLKPGDICEINLNDKNFKIKSFNFNKLSNFLKNNTQLTLKEIIKDSVKVRLRSDVKTAILVSGGLDSAIVSNEANKISSNLVYYKCDFGKDEDDYYASYLSKELNINLIRIPMHPEKNNLLNKIENVIKIFEFPIPINGFTLSSNIIFEKLSKEGVKVVIDGMGADEIYGGYFDRYSLAYINSCIEKFRIFDLIYFIYYSVKYKHSGVLHLLKHTLKKILNFAFKFKFKNKNENPYLTKNQFKNFEDYQLDDNQSGITTLTLKLYNSSAMMNSVEARSPFYDYRHFFNISNDINSKFNKGLNKVLLRKHLPDNLKEIKNRIIKQPFRFGFETYFMKDKKEEIFKSIKNSSIVNSIIRENEVDKLFSDYSSSSSIFIAHRILRLYSVSVFEKIYGSSIK